MKKLLLTALAVGGLMLTSVARGETISPGTVLFTPGVSMTYEATLSSGHLAIGDGFTIFDVYGYTGMLAIDPRWTLSSTGPLNNPWGVAPGGPDNPALPNLTFTYVGPPDTVHQEFGTTVYSPFTIGTTAVNLAIDDWTSRDHNITPVGGEFVLGTPHTDQILVPAAPVPDAVSTMGLLTLVLMGVDQLRRRLG